MTSEWNVKPPGVASVSNVKSEVTSSEFGGKRGGEGEAGGDGESGGGGEGEAGGWQMRPALLPQPPPT